MVCMSMAGCRAGDWSGWFSSIALAKVSVVDSSELVAWVTGTARVIDSRSGEVLSSLAGTCRDR